MMQALSFSQPEVRGGAVRYFLRYGIDDQPARQMLIEKLSDKSEDVRQAAAEFFSRAGFDRSSWDMALSRLQDSYSYERLAGLEYLRIVGDKSGMTLGSVLPLVADPNKEIRSAAVDHLALCAAEGARFPMSQRLAQEHWRERRAAVDFFARVGGDESVRAAMLKCLDDEEWLVRSGVVNFYARFGLERDARQLMLRRLEDESWKLRQEAVEFFSLVPGDPEVHAAVFGHLDDEDQRVRRSVIESFCRRRYENAMRPRLLERLADEEWRVREAVIQLFAEIGDGEVDVRRAVLQRLKDDFSQVRRAAMAYLARQSSADAEVRQAVLERLEDDDPIVCGAAVELFSRHGSEEMEGTLIQKLRSDKLWRGDWRVGKAAAELLSALASDRDDAATYHFFFPILKHDHKVIRRAAVEFFCRRAQRNPETRSEFSRRLDDEDLYYQLAAFRFFLRLGFEADLAATLLGVFELVWRALDPDESRQFSMVLGRLAATDRDVRQRLLSRAKNLEGFSYGLALAALASERDSAKRARRRSRLAFPGTNPRPAGASD
jgi:HEAT repeat protein